MAHENNAGENVAAVRKMLDDMNSNIEVIPSSVMKISWSQSSSSGGTKKSVSQASFLRQDSELTVSRSASKAMTQISIHPLYKRIPQEVVEAVKGHRYSSVNSSAILIQSDRTPHQNQDRDDC